MTAIIPHRGTQVAATFRRRVAPAGGEAARREERLAREQAEKARRGAPPAPAARARRRRRRRGRRSRSSSCSSRGTIGGGGDGAGDGGRDARRRPNVTIPEQVIGDLKEAAKAAGCKLDEPADRGRQARGASDFTAADYKTNPPTSGNHFPTVVPRTASTRPGDTPQPRHARAHARARPDRRPVQARHARRDGRPARGAARRAERGLPHAAVREHRRTWTRRSPRPPGATR